MKLLWGVGINDAGYAVKKAEYLPSVGGKRRSKLVWACPYYSRWHSMICRGCSNKRKIVNPQYEDTIVCEDWLRFSNFRDWMQQQHWEGKELDKDILVIGNNIYSPDTCRFVPRNLNIAITGSSKKMGGFMLGVTSSRRKTKPYQAYITMYGKGAYLGCYETEIEGHSAWQSAKETYIRELVAQYQKDPSHYKEIAEALLYRAEILRSDRENGRETFTL